MIIDNIYEISLYTDYKTTIALLLINKATNQLQPWLYKINSIHPFLKSDYHRKTYESLENCNLLASQLINLYKFENKDNMAMYIADHHIQDYYWLDNCELYKGLCPKMMIRNNQCYIEIGGKLLLYTEKDFILFFTLLFYHYPDSYIADDNYLSYQYRVMSTHCLCITGNLRNQYWTNL